MASVPKVFDYEYEEVATPKAKPQVSVITEAPSVPRSEGDGPFLTSRTAVQFMVTTEGVPRRPMSSRMLDRSMSASEFAGLDAAAQAGMILYHVERLGRLHAAVVIASCAPRIMPCRCKRPCCSGRRISTHWHAAVNTIAQEALKALPPKSLTNYALRSYLVVKLYGGKESFKDIAKLLMLDEETVSRHYKAISTWLRGAKAKKGGAPIIGQEFLAWRELETLLWEAGIVR